MKSLENMIPNFEPTVVTLDESLRCEIVEAIDGAHRVVEGIYSRIDSLETKQAVREFIASDQIKQIDKALDRQIAIVKDSMRSEEDRRKALSRVKEGMDYWKKLIIRRAGVTA